jgi:membrane-anchored mycosin MYCP
MSYTLAFALRRTIPVTLRAESDGDGPNGLEQVLAYVDASRGEACIEPLDPSGSIIARGAFSILVAPSRSWDVRALTQAIHFLHLPAGGPIEQIKYLLAHDERIAYVEELSTVSRADEFSLEPALAPVLKKQWALAHCGFSADAWADLERGDPPGVIAVIDAGPSTFKGNPIPGVREIPLGTSTADHAAAVLSLIAPHANGSTTYGYSGAVVDYYNVFNSTDIINQKHWCTALTLASKAETAVINMSFCAATLPQCVADAMTACRKMGILLVAGMGPTPFPAQYGGVIAVGGADNHDGRSANSPEGEHMSLCAPAIEIDTIYGPLPGTSFAAPMVTAAIWLARHRRSDLTADNILDRVLQSAVNPKHLPKREVGFGRIDITRLRANLK